MVTTYNIKKLEDLLKHHIKLPILDQSITRLTAPGENYGSLILKLDVTYKSSDVVKTFHAVAKCVPPNKALQKVFNTKLTFKNEIGWYTQVIPTFQEFQKENDVQILDCFPEFYGSRLSLNPRSNLADTDGVILIENLAVKGYKTINRLEGFDLDTSKNILRKLADLHAVSISLKLKKPEVYQQNIKPFITHNKEDPENFGSTIVDFLETIKHYKPLMPKIKDAVKYKFNNYRNSNELWHAAIHNDFWINNIMIDNNQNIMIVDFQICSYGSVILDLMFFLSISVNINVGRLHLDYLIKFYYDEFIQKLMLFKVESTLFTYEDFLNELKIQGKGAFARALFTVLIVLGEESRNHNPDEESFDPDGLLKLLKENLTEKQKQRCCFLVDEFILRDWI